MRLSFLLRPGWIAMIVTVIVFAVACFTLLAPWQFRRNTEQQAQNAELRSAFANPPSALEALLPAGRTPDGTTEWRRVTLTGSYLPHAEVLARLRTVQGEAAFEVLTPFKLASGEVAVVDRGYIRPVRGTRVPDYPEAPAGRVTVQARVRVDETDPQGRAAFTADGHRQAYVVNSRTVGQPADLHPRPGYFELTPDQPGVLGALPLPELDSGPYLSYALQWLAFGAMALLGMGYLIWRETQPDSVTQFERFERLDTSDDPEEAAKTVGPQHNRPVADRSAPAPRLAQPATADRYGRRR